MRPSRNKHKQSRYFTIMLVPDSTSKKVRSLKVPHWFIHGMAGVFVSVFLVIGFLSMVNNYSKDRLEETQMQILSSTIEKEKLIEEREKIINAKEKIEKDLNEKQGDFDKQLDYYASQISAIESRLSDIEKQAKESYDKMNLEGSPVSMNNQLDGLGGLFIPSDSPADTRVDKLNLLIASINVHLDTTEEFIKNYSSDVDKFMAFEATLPSLWPVKGRITSEQGGRADPFTGASANHSGMDIAVPTGTKVKAAAAGRITKAAYVSGYGNLVIIDHGNGYETYYGHNSSLLVEVGDYVDKGDYVAKSGNTGRSTGPHVHYEVRYYGKILNPRKFLS